jgi:hypothetical protein
MSAYNPPVENVPIFDAGLFSTTNSSTSGFLTITEANRLYLQFPFGQGTETIPAVNITGNATIGNNLILDGTYPTNYLEFPDGTRQYTSATTTQTYPFATWTGYNLQGGNPIPPPYPTISFGNIASKNYWDGVVFRVVITIQNNQSSTTGTFDTNLCLTYEATMTMFPKAFIGSAGANIPVYFNNGIGATNTNFIYAPVSSSMSPYVANGRPYFATGILNSGNIANYLTPSLTNNGTTSTIVFNFPILGTGGPAFYNWTMSFELLNTGRYSLGDISTSNFTKNF